MGNFRKRKTTPLLRNSVYVPVKRYGGQKAGIKWYSYAVLESAVQNPQHLEFPKFNRLQGELMSKNYYSIH